jgi:protein-tyrosine phosphatase
VIDLHCHILPALDDGALDPADSVAMARQAERAGIDVVCATPHIRHDHDVRIGQLGERVAALQVELDRHGVGVRIARGGEVAQSAADGLDDGELRELSLDGGGWVLLEPLPGPLAAELPELVTRLAGRGTRSVIAHPERNAGEDLRARLRELAAAGCLLQWTADFVARAEDGARELVAELVGEGLVHVLASDAHSSHGGRAVTLEPGLRRLAELCDEDQLDWIARAAPEAVLRGEQPPPAPW